MATIKDIALKCDVSLATVSRTLNEDKTLSISDQKRALILKVAKELDYEPPRKRKSKTKFNTKKVALLTWISKADELEDPYYLLLRRKIEEHAKYKGIVLDTIFNDKGKYSFKELNNHDAIIAIGKYTQEDVELLSKAAKDIIFVDSSPARTHHDSIIIDFVSAMIDVMDYLTETKWYREIGFIGGKEYLNKHQEYAGEVRAKIVAAYLKDKSLLNEEHFYYGNYTEQSGYDLMNQALQNKKLPEAFFCSNDCIGVGALKALHEAGKRVPEDIALVAFNDIEKARTAKPALTTVKVPIEFMARATIELLIERFEGRTHSKKVLVKSDLVIRETT
jgi:LacI family transcriptional regulator